MFSFIDAIPAKQTISHSESLNVLGGVVNSGDDAGADITLWGKVNNEWKPLETQRVEIGKNEHKHLYYTLRPEMLSTRFGDEEIDEIELAISDTEPIKPGVIVFVE